MAKIYPILMCETLKQDDNGFPDFGNTRLVGYYTNINDAIRAVETNACDINETCYDYAVIEGVEEGLYQCATYNDRLVFQYDYNSRTYKRIANPKCLHHIAGITIG
jgi:hypothetical protein